MYNTFGFKSMKNLTSTFEKKYKIQKYFLKKYVNTCTLRKITNKKIKNKKPFLVAGICIVGWLCADEPKLIGQSKAAQP